MFAHQCNITRIILLQTCCLMLIAHVQVTKGGTQKTKNPYLIVDDPRNDISVNYVESVSLGVFTARLQEGWSFSVHVDGNQDGEWGYGADNPRSNLRPTDDYSFGQTREGTPCSQYIYSAKPNNPDYVASSSTCGAFSSSATVDITTSDRLGFFFVTYKIPKVELFKNRSNAHVLIAVWDGNALHHYYTLKNPLLLKW